MFSFCLSVFFYFSLHKKQLHQVTIFSLHLWIFFIVQETNTRTQTQTYIHQSNQTIIIINRNITTTDHACGFTDFNEMVAINFNNFQKEKTNIPKHIHRHAYTLQMFHNIHTDIYTYTKDVETHFNV